MVVDTNITQNGTVFVLLFVPLFITCIAALGKFLFDYGILFVESFFNVHVEKDNHLDKRPFGMLTGNMRGAKNDKIN